jgi:hypothetical protein
MHVIDDNRKSIRLNLQKGLSQISQNKTYLSYKFCKLGIDNLNIIFEPS